MIIIRKEKKQKYLGKYLKEHGQESIVIYIDTSEMEMRFEQVQRVLI